MTKYLLPVFACNITLSVFAQDKAMQLQPMVALRIDPVAVNSISGADTVFAGSVSFAPLFSIRHKSGLGLTYSPKFIFGGIKPGLYVHEITAGVEQYDKDIFDYALNYCHYFFTNNPAIPFTPLNHEIYGSVNYKKTWLNPLVSIGIGFGNDISERGVSSMVYDLGASAGVGHSFKWENAVTSGYVRPMLLANGGTNQYFSLLNITKYIGRNKKFNQLINNHINPSANANAGRGRGNGNSTTNSGSNTSTSGIVTDKEKFALNNIESGIEASIEMANFSFRPTINAYFPIGASAGTDIAGYWQLIIEYRF